MQLKSLHLTVSGRVHGVGFRFFTQDIARSMGITGYVKNTFNGDVEIIAEGEEFILYKFLDKIKQGPSLSRVINVDADWNIIKEKKYNNFSITF